MNNKTNITKKIIVDEIASRTGVTQVDTKLIIESFLSTVSKAMIDGNNIEIRGFGRFKVKETKARQARNPKTGEKMFVEAGIKPVFEPSKELRNSLNDSLTHSIHLQNKSDEKNK
jgi:DNA-binding protein HU-beta/integration host factor subunit beta